MKWLDCAVEVSEEKKTRWAVIEKPTSTCFRKKQHSKEFLHTTDVFLLYLRHNNNVGELVFDED
jgi:hypothetical protein